LLLGRFLLSLALLPLLTRPAVLLILLRLAGRITLAALLAGLLLFAALTLGWILLLVAHGLSLDGRRLDCRRAFKGQLMCLGMPGGYFKARLKRVITHVNLQIGCHFDYKLRRSAHGNRAMSTRMEPRPCQGSLARQCRDITPAGK
jgi:hypothetical protein